MIEIVLVVAIADNGIIGAQNAIPWRLKSDMRRFKTITMGKPIVMGRKTFQSFPRRPLPGRTNIVVSRDLDFRAAGAVVTHAINEAITIAHADALRRSAAEIAVIGGAQIYAQALPFADRLEITEVHAQPQGDTVFPAIDRTLWQEVARENHPSGADDSAAFSYVTWRRLAPR